MKLKATTLALGKACANWAEDTHTHTEVNCTLWLKNLKSFICDKGNNFGLLFLHQKNAYFRHCFNHHKLGKEVVIKQHHKYSQLDVPLLLHYTNLDSFDETFFCFLSFSRSVFLWVYIFIQNIQHFLMSDGSTTYICNMYI